MKRGLCCSDTDPDIRSAPTVARYSCCSGHVITNIFCESCALCLFVFNCWVLVQLAAFVSRLFRGGVCPVCLVCFPSYASRLCQSIAVS